LRLLLSFIDQNSQLFQEVLIDHVIYAASPPEPDFSLVNEMLSFIVKLARLYPRASANAFRMKLHLMEGNLRRGTVMGPQHADSKTFPGTSELALLRVIGGIWSTSDMSHPVVGPAQLLMGAYLELGRIRSLKDLASGLFLATLFCQVGSSISRQKYG
jgi:nucleolar protein 14